MKTLTMLGLSALLSMSTACAAQSEPSGDHARKQASPIDGEPTPTTPTTPSTPPTPPTPTTCTPLPTSSGTANPASVYCAALGNSMAGDQCTFADGTSCEQWAFYRGECGQSHSFCNLNGGSASNKVEDMGTWTASYALCTLPDGKSCQEATFAQSCSCE